MASLVFFQGICVEIFVKLNQQLMLMEKMAR